MRMNEDGILQGAKNNVLELSYVNLSEDEDENFDDDMSEKANDRKVIEDFDAFKKQFNLRQILDKLVVKREFFIPSKAKDIHEFYEFERELGEGAYGKVYQARHKKSGNIVSDDYYAGIIRAIKLIAREKIKRFDRLINEIHALKTLDHPNVIKLFEIYEDPSNIYLVQEYLMIVISNRIRIDCAQAGNCSITSLKRATSLRKRQP